MIPQLVMADEVFANKRKFVFPTVAKFGHSHMRLFLVLSSLEMVIVVMYTKKNKLTKLKCYFQCL